MEVATSPGHRAQHTLLASKKKTWIRSKSDSRLLIRVINGVTYDPDTITAMEGRPCIELSAVGPELTTASSAQ